MLLSSLELPVREIIQIAASKEPFSPAGTYLVHLSLILFVLGFMVSSFWGFRESYFIVPEGSARPYWS